MKKIISGMIAFSMLLMISSCGGDSDEGPVSVSVDAPASITLGAGFTQTISIDASGSDLTLASIEIKQGSTTIVSDEINLSGSEAALEFSFTIDGTGEYDATVVVEDASGTTETATIALTIACMPSPQFVDAAKVSLVAEAPGFTTGTMGLVGDLTDWADGGDITLTKIGASDCYCTLVEPADISSGGFKFRLDGTWDKVEKDGSCGEIDNRTAASAVASDTVNVVIAEWRNSDQFGGGCGN